MPAKPLLALVMIVKNEAKSLAAIFESVRGVCDRAVILDTGSTDGTQALARRLFREVIPGKLHEEPFVDFGTSRNRALELAEKSAVFGLVLSGDETLKEGASLRAFCEANRKSTAPEHGAYRVSLELGPITFDALRIARFGAGWKFVGKVHEVLQKDGVSSDSVPRVPNASIHHDVAGHTDARTRARLQRDLEILEGEARENPSDPRPAFYLAQTLELLERLPDARAAYERRIALGGWREELYDAHYRIAQIAQRMNQPWSAVVELYLKAHEVNPRRAEPLYQIGYGWMMQGNAPLAYLFGQRAWKLPLPPAGLRGVFTEVYAHLAARVVATTAWFVGEHAEGEAALAQALVAQPQSPQLLRLAQMYAQGFANDPRRRTGS